MSKSDWLLDAVGIPLMVVVSGFLGSIIGLTRAAKFTPAAALVSIISGVSCAAFITPMIHYWWELDRRLENGIAFFLGLLGLQITGKVYDWFTTFDFSRLVDYVLNKLKK